jgi:predicted adenine nucleotide alpha hydrolase (AANH) superfamily ATPase
MMILVHACCTTCSLKMIKSLEAQENIKPKEVTLYYYNPNIHPESEWHARRVALQETMGKFNYKVVVANWTPKDYFDLIKPGVKTGWDTKKEWRCPKCWFLRLEKTFVYAKEHGFEAVSSTMITSPYLNRDGIINLGSKLAAKYELKFLAPHVEACDNCFTGYYMQNYCGCIYSLNSKLKEKYLIDAPP